MTVPQHETAPRKSDMEDNKTEEAGHRRRSSPSLHQPDKPTSSLPTPPDGGWGWMVVFASFMIHVLADGFTYTFGIYFVQLVSYYNATAAATSWIASILVGVTLGSGGNYFIEKINSKFSIRYFKRDWIKILGNNTTSSPLQI